MKAIDCRGLRLDYHKPAVLFGVSHAVAVFRRGEILYDYAVRREKTVGFVDFVQCGKVDFADFVLAAAHLLFPLAGPPFAGGEAIFVAELFANDGNGRETFAFARKRRVERGMKRECERHFFVGTVDKSRFFDESGFIRCIFAHDRKSVRESEVFVFFRVVTKRDFVGGEFYYFKRRRIQRAVDMAIRFRLIDRETVFSAVKDEFSAADTVTRKKDRVAVKVRVDFKVGFRSRGAQYVAAERRVRKAVTSRAEPRRKLRLVSAAIYFNVRKSHIFLTPHEDFFLYFTTTSDGLSKFFEAAR